MIDQTRVVLTGDGTILAFLGPCYKLFYVESLVLCYF